MQSAFICDAVRTPVGRYGGALATIRADDLAAIPIRALRDRNSSVDWMAVDDVIYGCANQAGEDNRNVARMAALLAGLPLEVPGTTINRLCGSGMDAIGFAARAIKSGESDLMIAGGVESMTRAPFGQGKADSAFSRSAQIFDTTIGWRLFNPTFQSQCGTHSMPQTADNVAADYKTSRANQDLFALRSQQRWAAVQQAGRFRDEIMAVMVPQRKGEVRAVDVDEHPRPDASLEALRKLKGVNAPELTVTVGNASGVNDGSCAQLVASEAAAEQHELTPRARVDAMATAGVAAYCLIKGVVHPNVGFEIKLPTSGWNGRFFSVGCGNYCGMIEPTACNDPLGRGYACLASDSGHLARPEDVDRTDGRWAFDNLQAELDWGGRASHVTAVAGKAITEFFYGKAPAKSYFMGCSYGGHQAMVLAQRFPWDFDGIVGGGAPNSISGLMQQNAWAISNAWSKDFKSVFTDKDIAVLHGAALAKCDMDDGVKDGLVSNPRGCSINVDALVCKPGESANCLSREIAEIARKMYAGPSDSRGRQIAPGGWEPGTELFWQKVYRPDGTGLAALSGNYFRFMGSDPDIGPDWKPRDYDFGRDYKRNDVMETLYAAANPDLRRFKANGGKFINFVGEADLGTVPATAIDCY